MSVESARRTSVWIDTGPEPPALPRLEGNVTADVAVLGGGIVGITTALLLSEAGMRVVLLDANRLACGVSGFTTAKVSSQHGMIYAQLRSSFGAQGARTYGEANEAALAWIADRVEQDGIDCDFRRQASYAYLGPGADRAQAEREAEAAIEAGLPAALVDETPLPYPVAAAVRFDDQAEFHPRKYLLALAAQLEAVGCEIYEHSHAVEVDDDEQCVVKTPGGSVTADRVVVATHYPFLDRAFAFARVHPRRSYALVCRIAGEPPPGMFISGDSPTRSVRAVPLDGEELLLVGGEGHKTGEGGDTEERYRTLERFAREHWDVRSVDYRWSSQDGTTIDGVPYVGPIMPHNDRVLMATGFAKWGMTNGTAAALMLADRLLGRENPWASLFNPNRVNARSAVKFVEENAQVGLHFIGDRLTKRGSRPLEDLAPGEGDIVQYAGEKVAGHRRDDGTLVAVSPLCTHLGCQVNWNSAERSWDCPCHGSRFDPDGNVLQGPAVHRLEHKPLGDVES
jgi:glycine/D-amino acid oxidase-like deaminating enzyme/nitrite reductase/ring-hydroxylating ferredoxin subunit